MMPMISDISHCIDYMLMLNRCLLIYYIIAYDYCHDIDIIDAMLLLILRHWPPLDYHDITYIIDTLLLRCHATL